MAAAHVYLNAANAQQRRQLLTAEPTAEPKADSRTARDLAVSEGHKELAAFLAQQEAALTTVNMSGSPVEFKAASPTATSPQTDTDAAAAAVAAQVQPLDELQRQQWQAQGELKAKDEVLADNRRTITNQSEEVAALQLKLREADTAGAAKDTLIARLQAQLQFPHVLAQGW